MAMQSYKDFRENVPEPGTPDLDNWLDWEDLMTEVQYFNYCAEAPLELNFLPD